MMRDKAIAECLGALVAMVDKWFLASLPGPRGADASVLADALLISGIKEPHEQFADVTMAYHAALSHAKLEDRILVFGSFVTVGAIMHALN
jgi:dihydrofolate synthase/folylpolyglutamate synthase